MKHIKLFEQFVNESDQNVWEPVENAQSPTSYKSRTGIYIINMTSKKVDGTINKIIKKQNVVEGDGYKILADAGGSIVFFEATPVAEEVAKMIGGEAVSNVTLANGKTEAASSRGGSFIIIK
jgi:hypothetical protein